MIEHKDIESLLPDYFRGNLSEAECKLVDEWICSGQKNREIAEEICLLEQAASRIGVQEYSDTESRLRTIHRNMRRSRIRHIYSSVQRWAAILSIPLLLATAWFAFQFFRPQANPPIELRTASGMTSCTTLPDGSRVWLNSNSTLTYPSRFANTREVTLDGEGFFEVAKDKGRKFLVHAGTATLEVLGTSFNVEAYSDISKEIRTTLLSGSVRFRCPGNDGREKSILMHPGECITYLPETGRASLAKKDGMDVIAWKDGKTVLDNTSLEDALRAIGNRFNVEFLVRNDKLLANRYTGTFSGQTLEVVLEHFKRTTDIHFDTNLKTADPDNVSGRQIIIVY
ncbi:MAG: FecR domain-containing protein [Bacteroidales bacterium]|nr:FecR domain-containing protein [Bacteroidales bacterium]